MEILVKVQIDLSADAKSFLASLMGKKQDEAAQAPGPAITANVIPQPAKVKPVAEKPVAEKPVAEKPVAEKPVAEKPVAEKPVAEKPVAEKPTTGITLADVRTRATPLIENYRSEIMTKLRELGAVSVSTLKPEHFQTMLEFLNTLK